MTVAQSPDIESHRIGRDESARYWRVPALDHLECLSATFRRHSYSPHVHETFVVGIIEQGVEQFDIAGTTWRARPGDLVMVNPDTLHDGKPATDYYRYRMLYPTEQLLRGIADEIGLNAAPRFETPVVHDPVTWRQVGLLHRMLEAGDDALAQESLTLAVLGGLLGRHTGRLDDAPPARAPAMLERVRERMEAEYARPLALGELAATAGLSRYHLIRAFRRSYGVTPHLYLTARRLRAARALIVAGTPLAEAALGAGFADQSHLNRLFKAWYGVTPGQFRRGSNIVQESPPPRV
ncbi:AraC family transcriptional regulator [Oceanibacterium hippocampi]|uniref:HTH-type transcriptional activator RhaR n=1 Tax=Oceanibacterium hippocampi TaxID=745714 RepID=A0A1Y5T608_9PROT|nr:AraC family transcriptional regulator [Oceanibacterium hippocampi]SLN53325.1 HTH-type transcriptional activator RhaR [Oceanibacterium hippocampi]